MDGPKFTHIETYLLISYVGLLDVIGMLLPIAALDDFGILDILNLLPIGYFFIFKGMSFGEAKYFVSAGIIEFIPYLGALPLNTIGLAVNLWVANHPESIAAEIVKKTKKAVPGKQAPTTGRFAPKTDSIIKKAA